MEPGRAGARGCSIRWRLAVQLPEARRSEPDDPDKRACRTASRSGAAVLAQLGASASSPLRPTRPRTASVLWRRTAPCGELRRFPQALHSRRPRGCPERQNRRSDDARRSSTRVRLASEAAPCGRPAPAPRAAAVRSSTWCSAGFLSLPANRVTFYCVPFRELSHTGLANRLQPLSADASMASSGSCPDSSMPRRCDRRPLRSRAPPDEKPAPPHRPAHRGRARERPREGAFFRLAARRRALRPSPRAPFRLSRT